MVELLIQLPLLMDLSQEEWLRNVFITFVLAAIVVEPKSFNPIKKESNTNLN